jgi:hypothetical protein
MKLNLNESLIPRSPQSSSDLARSKVKISPRPGLWGRSARKGQERKPQALTVFLCLLPSTLATYVPHLSPACLSSVTHTLFLWCSPFCLSFSLISITHSLIDLSLASSQDFLSLCLAVYTVSLLLVHPRGLHHLIPSTAPRPSDKPPFIH